MGSILSTVLIAAPLGFLLGWLLCKAVFQHLAIVRPVSHAAGAVAPAPRIEATETAAPGELQLLKEALAERDHLITNLKQQLATKLAPLEDTPANAAAQEAKLREAVKALREGLAEKDKALEKLQASIRLAGQHTSRKSPRLLAAWRGRVKRLIKQIRQQKMIITELREELKQRELRQRELEAISSQQTPHNVHPVAASRVENQSESELQSLRGVGPAMQIKLNQQGIYKLRQLADMSPEDLQALGKALSINQARMAKVDWGNQARQLLRLPAAASPAQTEVRELSAVS